MRRFIVIAALLIATIGAALVIARFRHPGNEPAVAKSGPGTLVISADTAGWIMPCGCTANQSGGLLRRATYLDRLREKGAAVLYADAGGASAGASEYQKVKFEAVLGGELAMGIAAHNIGRSEAALGPRLSATDRRNSMCRSFHPTRATPAARRLRSAVRIVSWGGRRLALAGVLSPQFATAQISAADPRGAILTALAPLKGKYDALVVLAYLPEPELRQLATDLPEADAVIGGPTNQAFAPARLARRWWPRRPIRGSFWFGWTLRPAGENGVATSLRWDRIFLMKRRNRRTCSVILRGSGSSI